MKIKGPLIQRGNPERKWDTKKGWVTTEKLRGEYQAICAFAARQVGRYSSIAISPDDGGMATLTLTLDGPESNERPKDPSTDDGQPAADSETWELKGNDLTKDLWSFKRIKNLSSTNYDWLRTNVKTAQEKGTWYSIEAAITDPELKKMFRLFMEGTESYSVSQYVISRQLTTSGNALGSFVTKGANIQYTTAQLMAEFKVPNGLRFTLPRGGWIMRTPTVTFEGAKWSNSVEWWHADEWNEVLYPKFNTPEAAEPPPIIMPPSAQVNPPKITKSPASQAVMSGSSVTFECEATGIKPLQFAWFNGSTLVSLGAPLQIAAASATDAGTYTCIVTNPGGKVTSAAASLSVSQ